MDRYSKTKLSVICIKKYLNELTYLTLTCIELLLSILKPPDQQQSGISLIETHNSCSCSKLDQWKGIWEFDIALRHFFCELWSKVLTQHNCANRRLYELLLWSWYLGEIVNMWVVLYFPLPERTSMPTMKTVSGFPSRMVTCNLQYWVPFWTWKFEHH